jgi:hypothetical protein
MNKEQLFDVVVATIKTNRNNMIALIRKNGVPLNANASDEQIFNAFVSLVKTSAKFREEYANLVKSMEAKISSNALNANGNEANLGAEPKTNWKEYLGKVFTPEVTSNLVNNLFGLFGGGTTNTSSEFEQAQLRYENQDPAPKGLSTGAIIGISVGVIALIGLTVYLVKNK